MSLMINKYAYIVPINRQMYCFWLGFREERWNMTHIYNNIVISMCWCESFEIDIILKQMVSLDFISSGEFNWWSVSFLWYSNYTPSSIFLIHSSWLLRVFLYTNHPRCIGIQIAMRNTTMMNLLYFDEWPVIMVITTINLGWSHNT